MTEIRRPADRPLPGPWTLSLPGGRAWDLGPRPQVMGVLNLTPDSFSDGGLWLEPGAAVDHALAMVEAGAAVIDLGAESTRPASRAYGAGAVGISVDEELRRLLPVLEALRANTDAILSVDTRRGPVARAALMAGADLINDVTALADPELAECVAEAGVPVVLMHLRGTLPNLAAHARYRDVAVEVRDELAAALARAEGHGVARSQTLVDPGIGFAKNDRHNLDLLRHLDRLGALERPLVVGASRKRFIGELTGTPADRRLPGSLAAVAWAAHHGAALVRVHDVAETRQFLNVWSAIAAGDAEA